MCVRVWIGLSWNQFKKQKYYPQCDPMLNLQSLSLSQYIAVLHKWIYYFKICLVSCNCEVHKTMLTDNASLWIGLVYSKSPVHSLVFPVLLPKGQTLCKRKGCHKQQTKTAMLPPSRFNVVLEIFIIVGNALMWFLPESQMWKSIPLSCLWKIHLAVNYLSSAKRRRNWWSDAKKSQLQSKLINTSYLVCLICKTPVTNGYAKFSPFLWLKQSSCTMRHINV